MSGGKDQLRLFLDEGVPDSVGVVFSDAGHEVVLLRNSPVPRGSSDDLVCTFAEINDAVLVAIDGDMKQIARTHGMGGGGFRRLNLIKLSCREPDAASRVAAAMSLIEHEWRVTPPPGQRRIFIEISDRVIRTFR